MKAADLALSRLAAEPAVWVTVAATRGSVPRDAGTWMVVFGADCIGTIGGGHVEFQAIAHARACLAGDAVALQRRFALGPSLGQCCGGVMDLQFEPVDNTSVAMLRQRLAAVLTPLAVFGGGHVGQALVQVLARLPYTVHWIDSRDGVFPEPAPAQVVIEHSDPVHAAVADLPPGSLVLVMSFRLDARWRHHCRGSRLHRRRHRCLRRAYRRGRRDLRGGRSRGGAGQHRVLTVA